MSPYVSAGFRIIGSFLLIAVIVRLVISIRKYNKLVKPEVICDRCRKPIPQGKPQAAGMICGRMFLYCKPCSLQLLMHRPIETPEIPGKCAFCLRPMGDEGIHLQGSR